MNEWLYKISPCLRLAGDSPHPPGWVEAMRVIYEHELVLFSGSTYRVETENEKFECRPGTFIIIPPGLRHITRESAKASGHRFWIHFDWIWQGAFSQPIMTYSPAKAQENLYHHAPDFVPQKVFYGELHNFSRVLELFRRIENLFLSGSGREQMLCRGLLLELLLEILTPETEAVKGEDNCGAIASKIRRLLNQESEKPLSASSPVQELLKTTGLSYAHQCRVFKEAYGISPLQYMTELRMTRIKNLIKDTDMSLSEIAEFSGFENAGYFSRAFKKNTGMSPKEYRRNA